MSSRIHTKFQEHKIFFAFLIIGAVFFVIFARGGTTIAPENLKKGITCKDGQWNNSPYFSGDVSDCPDIVEYLFKPGYVNEKASELYLRFTTFPAGKFGMALKNSGWVSESYYVDVDTTDALRTFNKDGKASEGLTLRAKMSTDNSLFYYPFDRYFGEIKVQAVEEISKKTIPTTIVVEDSSLSGWRLSFSESGKVSKSTSNKAIYEEGRATLFWSLSRASVVYLAVSILLILMIIALGSAFAITRSIAKLRRPPSMNLLLWLATVLFAILQVRSNFPGNPPVGLLIDFLVVFPVLGLLLILGIANTIFWLNRSDWDYENEKSEFASN